MIQLEDKYLAMLRAIVAEQVDTAVWEPVVFGSRASGRAARFSDIDLGFRGPQPLPQEVKTRLWDALDESDIPYKVDIVDLSAVGLEFRQVAEKTMVAL